MPSRRKFLKASALAYVAGRQLAFGQNPPPEDSVLVEAAHFVDHGGWKLDTQFQNILGFSYLLAHGLGDPVRNAITNVHFPRAGKYHVWVHTKDWCPGEWRSPGRFKLLVQKEEIRTEFGTEPGWSWQSGGTIDIAEEELDNFLELQDLTGFEGRCSAVYFTLDENDAPPNDKEDLFAWRRQMLGLSADPSESKDFDVVIVGGGLAGCAAALAAEERGLKVAIIHNRPILGGNASGEIRVHTEGIHGRAPAERILKKIDRMPKGNGHALALLGDRKRRQSIKAAKGISTFLSSTLIGVETEASRILSCDALEEQTGIIRRFKAPIFIDCTGDGWLGVFAGAEFRYGRESKNEFNEGWDKHGDLWSPEEADNRVMGTSVMWNSKRTDRVSIFPEVPWAKPVAKNNDSTQGEWQWEYSHNDLHQVEDAEQIRDHMFRAIYGSFSNAKRRPQNATVELEWVSFLGGKRESRRLVGDHLYTGVDSGESVEFPDAVVVEVRHIDSHYQQKLRGNPLDFLSEAIFKKPKNREYYIPFRSLYSKDIENLMMAGRCFSCSHIGLAGPRVMLTCGQMGVATGFAASLCKKHGVIPREIGQDHIAELRTLCGYT